MEVEVNLLAVFLAAVAAMIVGMVWYAKPVMGAEWMKLAKVDEKKSKKEGPKAMVVMFVLALLAAYVLAYLTFTVGLVTQESSFLTAALKTSVMVWVGFFLYQHVTGAMFEQRPPKLLAINAPNSLITLLAMGLVIGLLEL